MISALFFTCLILIPSLTQSADDALPSLAQSLELLQLKEPKTPQEFMLQLRRAESAIQEAPDENDSFRLFSKKHSMIFSCYNENYQQKSLLAIKAFMQKIGCEEFHDYFIALASSSLPNKTDDIFVKIPYFKKLAWESQEKADQAFGYYNELENEPIYHPIKRLLLAAFLGTPINVNNRYTYGHPSTPVLNADDIELLKKLLRHGLDTNIGESLSNCKSLQTAQLLLMHGANFVKQHKEYDLIEHQCNSLGSDNDSSLLALFLPYAPLNKANQFGKKWFNSLIKNKSFFATQALIERIAILLQHGCHYDQEQADAILQVIDKRAKPTHEICYKAHASNLFKQAETSPKNIVIGLHQRALTGKRFHFKRAPQI